MTHELSILFCGDVVGRAGREAVLNYVPALKKAHSIDCVVVSGDNAAHGFGITPDVCREFFAAGVDVITGGDHVWDQKPTHAYLNQEARLLRPHNFPKSAPGSGWYVFETMRGKRIGILHVLGQVFHKENLDCPFACAKNALAHLPLSNPTIDAILVDMHCEATSEKNAMGIFLDSNVSAVLGSHTHIPTADGRILPGGTAYQTDVGMCGDYNSIIGFHPDVPLQMFTQKMRKARMQPASGVGTLCASLVKVKRNGLADSITPIMLDGAIGIKP